MHTKFRVRRIDGHIGNTIHEIIGNVFSGTLINIDFFREEKNTSLSTAMNIQKILM